MVRVPLKYDKCPGTIASDSIILDVRWGVRE